MQTMAGSWVRLGLGFELSELSACVALGLSTIHNYMFWGKNFLLLATTRHNFAILRASGLCCFSIFFSIVGFSRLTHVVGAASASAAPLAPATSTIRGINNGEKSLQKLYKYNG